MQIEYKYGNILDTDARYICHCVNAQGKMRSGVAKAIREQYPKAYEVYMQTYETEGLRLGQVIGADCGNHVILNLVGQNRYGYDGRLYVDYIAIRKGIYTINENIKEPVAFPLIGCGLAGGDWKIVSSIIEEESTNFQPIVYLLNDAIPF
jgi:O-acetyl-ADP-ribose deacetylase (regulator of RNase III)